MKLSVVIPIYNEERTLAEIISQVEAVPINKELILVDDYSTDGTRDILAELEDKYKIVYHDKNKGKGAALQTGFKNVTGDIVVIQDADLEYDPLDWTALIQPISQGEADVVYGSRFMHRDFKPHYKMAYMGNKFLSFLTSLMYGQKISDMETCYKMMRRDIIQSINIKSNRFNFEPEITAKLLKSGHDIVELPIKYNGRGYGEGKKIGWKDGVEAIVTLIKYRFVD